MQKDLSTASTPSSKDGSCGYNGIDRNATAEGPSERRCVEAADLSHVVTQERSLDLPLFRVVTSSVVVRTVAPAGRQS